MNRTSMPCWNWPHDEGLRQVSVHVFLDGRDTPPKSARNLPAPPDRKIEQPGVGHIAIMIGRYYGMDRDAAGNGSSRPTT